MIRVVKVGGSLLDLSELPQRLRAWLSAQSPAHNVLIVGGGALVDQVRRRNAGHAMDEAVAHWMCIDLLGITAQFLHSQLPEFPLLDDDRALRERAAQPGATIFSPACWLRSVEPDLPGTPLPCTWDTTSDAIAGRLAVALRADEFVLQKSAIPRRNRWSGLTELAHDGYIDCVLAKMAAELPPTRLVNLRTDPACEWAIRDLVQELS
jgi:aspartokinase-like uncharacterized kinase